MTEAHREHQVLDTPTRPDWFPVDAAKTLSHQDLLGLNLQEIGAFWILRLFCWKDGSVPACPKRLAVLCRSTPRQMERMFEGLSHFFELHPDRPDRLIMPLVEEECPDGLRGPRIERQDAPASGPAKTDAPAHDKVETPTEVTDAPAHVQVEAPTEVSVAAVPPPAKQGRGTPRPKPEGRQSVPTGKTSPDPTPPATAPPSKAEPLKKSFFEEQEDVFDAHERGLCALSEARGELDRFKPERHYRMKASRRRAVAAAIQDFGFDVARQAAGNLVFQLQDEGHHDDFHPLDIERAFRDPERLARLFEGPDGELVDAIREHVLTENLEPLLDRVPAPWQPPPEEKPSFSLLAADQPRT